MKFKVLIAAIFLGLALPVAADFKTVAEAHEVSLANLRLPQSASGTVAFKTCDECAYQVKRVVENTQGVLNGKNLPLAKFRRGLLSITDRDNTAVTVLHHLEKDRVIQVAVTTY
jgi:copper chaperone CopZ